MEIKGNINRKVEAIYITGQNRNCKLKKSVSEMKFSLRVYDKQNNHAPFPK